jgi:pimeloyl-ACP methyl ester carboxylesterase
MPRARVNDVSLFCEIAGDAEERVVLVHGSWVDHGIWGPVVPLLAESSRVLTYDRRGHSQSEPPGGEGTFDQDVADLAALIENLDFAPAVLVGNSFGAIVALGLAARRPDLIRCLSVHEPPLFGLLAGDPLYEPILEDVNPRIGEVLQLIGRGEAAEAARQFVEIAIGPGSWAQLPPPVQQTFIHNASTFLDESRDPAWALPDSDALSRFTKPLLLSHGEQSLPLFPAISSRIAAVVPGADVQVFPGAGHVPHVSHPHEFVQRLRAFTCQPVS